MNLRKKTNSELSALKKRLLNVFIKKENYFYAHFQEFSSEVDREISRRNRALIFKSACRCLKLKNWRNQFAYAAHFADACINNSNYFSGDRTLEISGYYTKSGNPEIVYLVCDY